MIRKQCKELSKYVDENPNTKKEIKEVTGRFKRQMEVFKREMVRGWFETKRYVPVEKQTYDIDIQTDTETN